MVACPRSQIRIRSRETELTSLLQELTCREEMVSDERGVLHTQIDALRRELVDRLRDEGNVVISGSDFLDPGSAGVREPRNPSPQNSDGIAIRVPPAPDIGQTRHHRAIRRVGRSAEVAPAESPRQSRGLSFSYRRRQLSDWRPSERSRAQGERSQGVADEALRDARTAVVSPAPGTQTARRLARVLVTRNASPYSTATITSRKR
jgi:hypothetical protein